ncbi:MAG: AAA family ATPase [Intestinibacter sp.]|uniref:AAA family ATPase n=1 Tax=Intestinibacter sp. TaxID=1965304 RepID=UPI002A82D8F4|nr:AAA family ATPase [Intestinibacter sp.]MDY4574915.1 AAA family ATPase [Intestinibacter sp.]
MLNKFNINVDELKANIDGIKSMVNKKKNYQDIKKKVLNKHIELDDQNIIDISIDVNVARNENGEEVVLNSKNVDQIINDIAGTIVRNTNENMVMPKNIIISSKENIMEQIEYQNIEKTYDDVDLGIMSIEKPRYSMDEVFLNQDMKKNISRILAISKNKRKIVEELKIQNSLKGGNSILCNFYGESGSGKASVIHCIASEINKNIVTVNYNMIEAIPVYDIPKTIKAIFEIAKKQNAVVVITESNRLIKQKKVDSSEYYDNLINVIKGSIKVEIGKFDSLLFFTSTNKDKIDEYFSKLFFINVEFKNPDEYEREKLWEFCTKENVKLSPILDPKSLAQKYQNISRADIKDILFIAASIALENNRDILYESDFDSAYSQVLERY